MMGSFLKSLSMLSLAACVAGSSVAQAGVVATRTADATSFSGTPDVNTAGSASANLPGTFTVAIPVSAGSNNRYGQTFTTGATGFNLGSIAFYTAGQGGSNGVVAHLYSSFSGGTEADTFVNPNNPTPVDLLGGGAGLSFNLSPASTNGFQVLTFDGVDQIALAANTRYYFELANGDGVVNMLRAGSSPYAGGNAYLGADPSTFRGLPSSGGVRDSAFAVYAAVPEPASLALIGLGAMGVIRRRRA
jgi:hypothetical protein